jgi:hypothetical protein
MQEQEKVEEKQKWDTAKKQKATKKKKKKKVKVAAADEAILREGPVRRAGGLVGWCRSRRRWRRSRSGTRRRSR